MVILGINYFFHDTSACIIRDDDLVVALEEERFSRDKHTQAFPRRAIAECLRVAGLTAADIDHVALSIRPAKHWPRKVLHGLTLGRRALPFADHEFRVTWRKQRGLRAWLRDLAAQGARPQVHFVEHHLSHLGGSYLVSPYDHAALLSLDGSGEWSTGVLGEAQGATITRLAETFFPHSLGAFYEAATEYCGFIPNYDEGKTMGLAPHGDPARFAPQVAEMVRVTPEGRVVLDLSWFCFADWGARRHGDRFVQAFGPARATGAPIDQHHMDLAAAVQQVLEDRVLELCRILEAKTTARHLVVAGGVALNSVMNGRILRETGFEDLYVMPAAGDGGTAIGAAAWVHSQVLGRTERVRHVSPYVGNGYTDAEIEATLKACKLPYRRAADVCAEAAGLLHQGKILGWFQGRMEIGPRALGNRSILADPTRPEMKDRLNAEVKHREAFRPFAPSCTVEDRSTWFDITVEAPYMLKVCPVRPEHRARLPAITHVDGSARLQTVDAAINPRYHALLRAFQALSGVPVLVNTSFNVMGEPVVDSPLDAIRCFYSTGLDVLVLHDFIVTKQPAPALP